MKINNIDFNQEWAKGVSEKEFISQLSCSIPFCKMENQERKLELKKIYSLLTKKSPTFGETEGGIPDKPEEVITE
jgi:hypothetical protein